MQQWKCIFRAVFFSSISMLCSWSLHSAFDFVVVVVLVVNSDFRHCSAASINYWRVFNVINQVDERVLRSALFNSTYIMACLLLERVKSPSFASLRTKNNAQLKQQKGEIHRLSSIDEPLNDNTLSVWVCVSIALPFFRSNIINYVFFSSSFVFTILSIPSFKTRSIGQRITRFAMCGVKTRLFNWFPPTKLIQSCWYMVPMLSIQSIFHHCRLSVCVCVCVHMFLFLRLIVAHFHSKCFAFECFLFCFLVIFNYKLFFRRYFWCWSCYNKWKSIKIFKCER